MTKTSPRKGLLRLVHLEALVFLIAYFLVSNYVFMLSVTNESLYVSFLIPLLFGVLSSFAFLYLFGHQDFFHFIKKLGNEEKRNEKKYLEKFKHFGRMITCILISAIGGPIFLALTIRFLYSKSEQRYLVAFISVMIPTFFIVAAAKGLFRIFF